MRYFPLFADLRDRRVLVLGIGAVADIKAAALRRAGAIIDQRAIFSPDALTGCAFALGADADEAALQALSVAARAIGIPVNVVDRPDLSSCILPAIIDRDPVLVAVSTSGTAPVLARLLRAKIEALIPPAYGRLAALADRFKEAMRARFPIVSVRRGVLERLLGGDAAALMLAGQEAAAEAAFVRALAGDAAPLGIVYLVGAGPGAADLLTLRAHRLLGEADVIVHDRLVTDEVLDMARRDAHRIFVGKQRANHCMKQEDISALLVRLGREGKRVVRLKGGDPFVFGRGGEEAEALAAAGVAFEVVPGITAALACAAQAGVPLTHRDAARALTFVTGHTKDGVLDLNFSALVASQATLAVYMGVVSLPKLRAGLLAAGLPVGTPAALIERGGTSAQRDLHGTLDSLVAQAAAWSTGGPTLVLIGDAVGRGVALPVAAVA